MNTIPHAPDQWSAPVNGSALRTWAVRRTLYLYRKEFGPFYGGFRIQRVPMGTPIADEWLASAKATHRETVA